MDQRGLRPLAAAVVATELFVEALSALLSRLAGAAIDLIAGV
jgi:hypothetical protein